MSDFKELREQCYEANMLLPKLGLVLYTFGNVSCVDRGRGVFAIKPSGVPYEDLKPDHIVIVDLQCQVVEGNLRPSSDTKTHAYLYNLWNDIGGICHTHSTYAVAWAQAQTNIPIMGTTHADFLTSDIPCTEPMDDSLIEGDYEHNTGHQIRDAFIKQDLNHHEVRMILIGNHGPFTWGDSAQEAVYNSRILEELAKMAYLSKQINPEASRLKDSLIQKHFNRKHGKDAYYGQE